MSSLEVELLDQKGNIPIILFNVAKFYFLSIVSFCTPNVKYMHVPFFSTALPTDCAVKFLNVCQHDI